MLEAEGRRRRSRLLFPRLGHIMAYVRAISMPRAALASALSLWMAVAACVFGCLPAFAHAEKQASACRPNSLEPRGADCCHRESSMPAGGRRPSPNPSTSCCPTEAALTRVHKWQAAPLTSSLSPGESPEFLVAAAVSASPFSSSAQANRTGGRDTLQKKHVLRI